MKLTTIIGTTIAAVGLAACGSTVTPTSRPATPSPTVAPTPTATPAPTPGATPTSTLGVTVTVTCSNIPTFWPYPASPGPYPPDAILATVTWHNVKIGDWLNVGLPQTLHHIQPVLVHPHILGAIGDQLHPGLLGLGCIGR